MNEEELDMRTDTFCHGNFFYSTVSLDKTALCFFACRHRPVKCG